MSIDKKASKFLPQDVQDAINDGFLEPDKGFNSLAAGAFGVWDTNRHPVSHGQPFRRDLAEVVIRDAPAQFRLGAFAEGQDRHRAIRLAWLLAALNRMRATRRSPLFRF